MVRCNMIFSKDSKPHLLTLVMPKELAFKTNNKCCIVGQHSLMSKPFNKPHCFIAEIPAKVVTEAVDLE